jgi:membrane fusion protein, heavy metal efflux system
MKVALTATLVATLLLAACSKSENKAVEQASSASPAQEAKREDSSILHIEQSMLRDLRITTTPVESRSGSESTAILGELRPNETAYAEVGAPIQSRVVKIAVAPGQAVRAGQVLATLQSSEVGKVRADAITAQAKLDLAKRILDRKRRLGAERIVSQREIQEAEANVEAATAELRATHTTLRSLGVSASDSDDADTPNFTVRSPIAGTIIDREAIQGQLAEPSKPLFRIGSLARLWLTVHAFERDAVRVRVGSTARVAFPALPGRAFSGKVSLVGNEVERDSRTVPVRIEIANRDGVLRPGMSATAWLAVGEETGGKVLAVPTASLQRLEERWIVFIPRGQSEFEMRTVGRGRDLGGEAEIVSGLKPGEIVVVDGAFLLKAQAERSRGEGEEHEH